MGCGFRRASVAPVKTETLTGWGLTPLVKTKVASPREDEAQSHVRAAPHVIARGLGRAYGDSAVCADGVTLLSSSFDSISQIVDGRIIVGAGVSLDALLKVIVPQGWFVPVTPGTRFVTVGGAIAADIHGKNHHHDGSFGEHVDWIEMVLADGTTVRSSPSERSELFWATVGGMGLTGVVTRASIRLISISTSRINVLTTRHRDLDQLMAAMIERDKTHRYTVAWVDTLASGTRFGRSVLMAGEHAPVETLARRSRNAPLEYDPRVRVGVPQSMSIKLVDNLTIRPFNEVWYRKSPRKSKSSTETISKFFYPLDGVRDWNRLYGRVGFVQYQFVVPDDQAVMVREFIELMSTKRIPAFLSVLKRFGAGSLGWMSFPMRGWTLAVDIPADTENLGSYLDSFDERVAGVGGRVYLAKDSRMRASVLRMMYPKIDEFRELRDKLDSRGIFVSHQSRRLGL
ncbi:MAG: FAD-binding protein [Ilumatobacteraceae bacterium]